MPVHDQPLLVSWDEETQAVIVSDYADWLGSVLTPETLWQLIRDFQKDPDKVVEQRTGRARHWRYAKREWELAEIEQAATPKPITLDDLDL